MRTVAQKQKNIFLFLARSLEIKFVFDRIF